MRTYSIIFISTANEQGVFSPADATLGITTLQYWLACDGITDTALFPEDAGVDITNIDTKFEQFLACHTAKIFAISCWSNSFVIARTFAEMIRKARPEAMIIGGGAHFHSQDNVKQNLENGLFDIIFKGGADPFFLFCKNLLLHHTLSVVKTLSGVRIAGEIPVEGIHYREEGTITPRKHGILSRAVMPVMHLAEEYAEITALFSDRCANHCDYCTVFKNSANGPSRLTAESFVKDSHTQLKNVWNGPFKIAIMDSSPFMGNNRKLTLDTLRRLSSLGNNITYSVFADPNDLDDEFLEIAGTYPLSTFFIGRDRIDEDGFIGRKLKGRLRDQRQLNKEREMLTRFINKMQANENPEWKEIYLGYIISPYDSIKDADRLLDELKTISGCAEKINVQPNIFILNPYKGTAVQRKARHDIWDIADFAYPYPNVWKGKNTSMLWLELIRLVVSPVFSTGAGREEGLRLLEFAKYYAFGETKAPVVSGDSVSAQAVKAFIYAVTQTDLGQEATLDAWQKNLINLYWWGLALSATVKNQKFAETHGIKKMMRYIQQNDIMINAFQADLNLIKNKEHTGTWYEKFY